MNAAKFSANETDFYPTLFGLDDRDLEEFRRMIHPDAALSDLLSSQAEHWRRCRADMDSNCRARQVSLIVFVKELGATVLKQRDFSMELVISLSLYLIEQVELIVEQLDREDAGRTATN